MPPPPDGAALHAFAAELLPLPRSLTGEGVRATLRAVAARLDGSGAELTVHEVPTGTPALDWTVPQEWTLRRATVTGPGGAVIADSAAQPLAVVGYSVAVDAEVDRAELDRHLHSLPEQPDATPYRTTYYTRDWGFCLPHRIREALPDGRYRVRVDADLADGHLTYGEIVLPGAEATEVLLSAHTCHPGMANDNVSGIVVATEAARALALRDRRHTYRVLLAPGTIGALVWLASNRDRVDRLAAGLVLAGLGDRGAISWKRTRRADTWVDRAVALALRDRGAEHRLLDFSPWGYDERQYGSPGFDLPVGLLQRTPHGTYPEYHSDGDDLGFVTGEALADSLDTVLAVVDVLEHDRVAENLEPYGEPQLGRRGLYPSVGGQSAADLQLAQLWVLNLAQPAPSSGRSSLPPGRSLGPPSGARGDGGHGLLDIAERSGLPFGLVCHAAARLEGAGLLRVGRTGAQVGPGGADH